MMSALSLSKVQSPFVMLRTLIKVSYKDEELTNRIFDYISGRVDNGVVRVVCVEWKYEWLPTKDADNILRALSNWSKVLYNVLSLPDCYEPVKGNLLNYVRKMKQVLTSSLWKHFCKNPPIDTLQDTLALPKNDTIELCDLINEHMNM